MQSVARRLAYGHRTVEPYCGRSTGASTPRKSGLRHQNASFLELQSTVSSFDVALQPVREIFCFLSLNFLTRLRMSRLRQQTDGFSSPSDEQAEPKWQRLKMGCGGETKEQVTNRIMGTFQISRVEEPFVKMSAICWLV